MEALARLFDPDTSRVAAAAQCARGCEHDILRVLAEREDAGHIDATGHDVWERAMQWRDHGTVISAMSRLKRRGLVEVTGTRVPAGKTVAASTYRTTDAGRELLRTMRP